MDNFKKFIGKNSPIILSVVGVAGVIVTSGLTIKATIKANNLYNSLENKDELSKKDIIRLCWKEYIPAGLAAGTTIACILSANYLNQKVKASLLSAYCMLQNSYIDYRKAANELYEDSDIKIANKICENKYTDNDIICLDDGTQMFFDYESGTFFESTMDEMLKHESEFQERMAKYGHVTLNDWERIIGNKLVPIGDEIGWYSNDYHDVYGYPEVEIRFTKDRMSNGLECVIITFSMEPDINCLY